MNQSQNAAQHSDKCAVAVGRGGGRRDGSSSQRATDTPVVVLLWTASDVSGGVAGLDLSTRQVGLKLCCSRSSTMTGK